MMSNPSTILVVDDEPGMVSYLRTILEVDSYRVETASNGLEAVERVRRPPVPELVILDLLMPGMDGLQTLESLRKFRPEMRVIMLSCVNETRKVVEAMRLGADDYLTKPFHREDLLGSLGRILGSAPPVKRTLPPPVERTSPAGDVFIAPSSATKKIYSEAELVAQVGLPVLILGESGTGKEVLARHIHKLSPRAKLPFLKVNCAAVPSELLESELFGHEAGAFTGAIAAKPGKFEICNGGTILLDEIGEMAPPLQAKLLHVLQDQHFSRLGSRTETKVDVLILAATNRDISKAIAEGSFRVDLYYRLSAMVFKLPPLRERREDIPQLFNHFMTIFADKYGRLPVPLSAAMQERFQQLSWPGNIRELENVVKRILVLGEARVLKDLDEIDRINLPTDRSDAQTSPRRQMGLKSLVHALKDEAESEAIRNTLSQTNWNRKQSAKLLGISYKALLYKIREYGLDEPHSARQPT
ncbi:MAG TPA: sigma-54 dependent transcriptional regulator [Terriglobia bacterium]|nr:sigma-54 dependent transcriptional regulator [Terriglobia bacterium]